MPCMFEVHTYDDEYTGHRYACRLVSLSFTLPKSCESPESCKSRGSDGFCKCYVDKIL